MDERGNLSFIEAGERGVCPFEIERAYWIYDVPTGGVRDGRALRHTSELIVAMSGSFYVDTCGPDGTVKVHHLRRSDQGLLIPPGIWREIYNFSTNSVAMVIASGPYNPAEYSDKPIEPSPAPERLKLINTPGLYSHSTSTLDDVEIYELPRHRDTNGSLSVVQNGSADLPLDVARVFYIYDVPADSERGGHSHHQARELMVAMSGSFDVVLDDGKSAPRRYTLNRPYKALYVPAGIWRTIDNFSGGAVCTVLTDQRFSEADYVRDYETFKRLTAR